jgi:predicted  nucleic acid-binding Zn-ribbon protein
MTSNLFWIASITTTMIGIISLSFKYNNYSRIQKKLREEFKENLRKQRESLEKELQLLENERKQHKIMIKEYQKQADSIMQELQKLKNSFTPEELQKYEKLLNIDI